MLRFGINSELREYIISAYTNSTTTINCGPVSIKGIQLRRGVKQGDPLSPILFNMVLDELLEDLPAEVGVELGNCTVNIMAFADDIIILSQTKVGMNLLLEHLVNFFDKRSMKINAKKCFSLRTTTKNDRAPVTITSVTYDIKGSPIEACNYETTFKYLGIKFNPTGKLKTSLGELKLLTDRLLKAPLKPQQKLLLLTKNVLPKFIHQLVLGRVTKGLLQEFDSHIRQCVKTLLHLPVDTPNGYFYTAINDGGLGVPSLIHLVPRSTLKRMEKLKTSCDPAIIQLLQSSTMVKLKEQCLKILNMNTTEEAVKLNLKNIHRDDLIRTIDGKPLAEHRTNKDGQLWVTGRTNIVSGRSFINMVKLRIGRLETLENCNRGREAEKICRKCLRVNESLNHVLQNCHFTHFNRMKRHDAIAAYLQKKCESNGYQTLWEPIFTLPDRKLKPDLVIITPNEILVIDVSIVTERTRFRHMTEDATLENAWSFKRNYYNQENLINQLKTKFKKDSVWFGALIIGSRGIWCAKNNEVLRKLHIDRSAANVLVARCMEHSIRIWRGFMNTT